ncbi:endothelin-3 isoform X1 [Arapaima gigas]
MDLGVLLVVGLAAAFAGGTCCTSRARIARRRRTTGTSSLGAAVPGSGRAEAVERRGPAGGLLSREAACPACDAPTPRRRAKRCTCFSYKDKECVYYCHLDVIWINTPERTVPYGMSSYRGLQRSRRSGGGLKNDHPCLEPQRCSCSDPVDSECSSFCKEGLNTLPQTPDQS